MFDFCICNIDYKTLLQRSMFDLWEHNNELYKKSQSHNKYYIFKNDKYEKKITENSYKLCECVLSHNPIIFDCKKIKFDKINDIFNDIHKELNKKLNLEYKEIKTEDLITNKYNKIGARELFIYLANNFIQFVNEICACINTKYHEDPFNAIEQYRLTKYIYECILPCYNAIISIFKDYLTIDNINMSNIQDLNISKENHELLRRTIEYYDLFINKYFVPAKYMYSFFKSKLFYFIILQYLSMVETLIDSITSFKREFDEYNKPYFTINNLSDLCKLVYTKIFSTTESLLFPNLFRTVQNELLVPSNPNIRNFVLKCINDYEFNILKFKNTILWNLQYIYGCQNFPDSNVIYDEKIRNHIMEATSLGYETYNEQFENSEKSIATFHTGMKKMIDNMKNINIKLPHSPEQYLYNINKKLKKYKY